MKPRSKASIPLRRQQGRPPSDSIIRMHLLVGAVMVWMGTATRIHPQHHLQRERHLLFRHRSLQTESTTAATLAEFTAWLQRALTETDVCHVSNVSQKEATTISLSSVFKTWLHVWLHPHDKLGKCADVCEQVCLSLDENSCNVVDIYTGDCACPPIETCKLNTEEYPPDLSGGVVFGAACTNVPTVCEVFPFQECVAQPNGPSLCQCQTGFALSTLTGECVLKCANPGGNPCGPGSACIDDDELGFTCEKLVEPSVCPVGCPPTELCLNGTCECKAGFVRTDPFLPCAPE